jgi:hypothetical protein
LAATLRPTRPIKGRFFHKFVANADHGGDIPRLTRIFFDLAPQVLHVTVDRPLIPFKRFTLNRVQKLHAREDPTGHRRESSENYKFGTG